MNSARAVISTLSLHDALPISPREALIARAFEARSPNESHRARLRVEVGRVRAAIDRKSTRLNSSHLGISYAVFCLKKKNNHRLKRYNSIDNYTWPTDTSHAET